MDSFSVWRNWFKKQYGEIRDNFVGHEETGQRVMSLFKFCKFKPGYDRYAAGILIDIYRNANQKDISAVGATFSKSEAAMYVSSSLVNFEYDNQTDNNCGVIRFAGANTKLSESASGFIKYQSEKNRFLITDLELSLLFWKQMDNTYNQIASWNFDAYFYPDTENLLCANCFGEGMFKSMTIPKEDYESGLTGYALYSCNRINGTYGCKECGGEGASLESWYQAESPEITASKVPLKRGNGAVFVPTEGPIIEFRG